MDTYATWKSACFWTRCETARNATSLSVDGRSQAATAIVIINMTSILTIASTTIIIIITVRTYCY